MLRNAVRNFLRERLRNDTDPVGGHGQEYTPCGTEIFRFFCPETAESLKNWRDARAKDLGQLTIEIGSDGQQREVKTRCQNDVLEK